MHLSSRVLDKGVWRRSAQLETAGKNAWQHMRSTRVYCMCNDGVSGHITLVYTAFDPTKRGWKKPRKFIVFVEASHAGLQPIHTVVSPLPAQAQPCFSSFSWLPACPIAVWLPFSNTICPSLPVPVFPQASRSFLIQSVPPISLSTNIYYYLTANIPTYLTSRINQILVCPKTHSYTHTQTTRSKRPHPGDSSLSICRG